MGFAILVLIPGFAAAEGEPSSADAVRGSSEAVASDAAGDPSTALDRRGMPSAEAVRDRRVEPIATSSSASSPPQGPGPGSGSTPAPDVVQTAAGQPLPAATAQPVPERITRKWYFWVTVGAIVASAAALTGIAIRAAAQEKPDDLSVSSMTSDHGAWSVRF